MKTLRKLSIALVAMGLGAALNVTAAEADWTPETLAAAQKALPSGTVEKGLEAHKKLMCAGCHGPEGLAMMGAFPHVAGEPVGVTEKALLDYRSGRRAQGPQAMMMAGMAARLTDEQIADLAAYYAAAPGGAGTPPKADAKPTLDEKALMTLIKKGDRTRGITPCAACHGSTAKGNPNGQVPVLHGQNPEYLKATLRSYRSGERHSDLLKEMRVFAQALTDAEIDALATYYGAQPGHGAKPAAAKPAEGAKKP